MTSMLALRLSRLRLPMFAIPLPGGLQRTVKTTAIKKPARQRPETSPAGVCDSVIKMLMESEAKDRKSEREYWLAQQKRFFAERGKLLEDWAAVQNEKIQEWKRASYLESQVLNAETTVKRLKGDLNLRTSLEIIAPILGMRMNMYNTGVQGVINAIAAGKLDNTRSQSEVRYADARADILAKFSHCPAQLVDDAIAVLYRELSSRTYMYAEVHPMKMCEGEFTQAEIVAVMSVFLFVRRLVHCKDLDIMYTNSEGSGLFSISDVLWDDCCQKQY